jgi:hypothetical protein
MVSIFAYLINRDGRNNAKPGIQGIFVFRDITIIIAHCSIGPGALMFADRF